MSGNAPIQKFTLGYLSVNIWKNQSNGRDFYSADLQRSYKDDGGEWQNTTSLGAADLLNAAKLLQRAEQFISEQ